jgi:hypothetical protein
VINVGLFELEIVHVGVVDDTSLLDRFGNDDESLFHFGTLESSEMDGEGTYPIETVANEDLSRSLVVLLRESDDGGMVESFSTYERGPGFEDDSVRFTECYEDVSRHEWVEVLDHTLVRLREEERERGRTTWLMEGTYFGFVARICSRCFTPKLLAASRGYQLCY